MSQSPSAVLLDVGGVFLLPLRSRIRSALARAGHTVSTDSVIDRAHYVATGVFPLELGEGDSYALYWDRYLQAYARALGVDEDDLPNTVEHLSNEYSSHGLWHQVVEGSREGLAELVATGVRVGIVSNSDGTIEDRLRAKEILQIGAGDGVEVGCVVDSGQVGVEKPDPVIFEIALREMAVSAERAWYVGDTPAFDMIGAQRAGLQPILMDPFDVHDELDVPRVRSITEVAEMVT